MRYKKGPAVDPADVLPDGSKFNEHRRVQATAVEEQGPTRPWPGRKADDLCHRRPTAKTDRPEIDAIV